MNKVVAIATDPRSGKKVEAPFVSYSNDALGVYTQAAREIEKAHGFLPRWNDEVTVRF